MDALRIKRVDWLVGASVLGAVLMVWLVLTGLDAVMQFVRQLTQVGKNGYTVTGAMVYVLVTVPRRLYEMFGNAALIGGLMGLGGLAGSGELTALRACGLSKLRIAGSAVGVVAVLIAGVVVLGETAAPWGDQRAQAMQLKLKANNIGMAGNTGLWARDGERIINAKAALARQTATHASVQLADVRVFTLTPDGQLARFDWARTAEHDGRSWVLGEVRSTTLDEQGVHSTTRASERWDSGLDPRILEQSVIHPEYLPMRDLRRNMAYLEANGESPGVYALAFWARALYPVNVLVLVLCAMPFAFGALRSGGLGKRIFLGMLLAIGWYFLQKAMVSFGTVYGIPPMLANLLPSVLLALAAWLYFRRFA
ncbi:LPS export ABC transporter permease LptG [Fulvimonas soli]|jgi:lipopolysaccharide export system permease protein|uniref:Lipopolysaccharide export system permease protein n=1 Tax=Fulvimonas soli TaxID=155197 RepID=A0A316I6Z6_9GAMM|nr:LPS export ABC transporter permease LptG [Fulvimonas soli]PWK88525.1 lipopolysaccharide export system permease protein [Fulvimonas soli]TNY27471.1 LPS export ABC transporter permease LptG [Fulvimonas soli]